MSKAILDFPQRSKSDMAKKSKKPNTPKKAKKPVKKNPDVPVVASVPIKPERKDYYFNNPEVERLLTIYVMDGCIKVVLRDEIMSHASELISQVIRTHNLHNIYGGREDSTFGDLFQVAWAQIESTLYKFDWRPGHAKVFNMWSQVAKTVCLAYIKKETRDKKNSPSYRTHLQGGRTASPAFERFLAEARYMFKYNEDHLCVLEALEWLYLNDPRPYDGIIGKLVKRSGLSRPKVSDFIKLVRVRGFEFTDAPCNEERPKKGRSQFGHHDYDSDE